MSTTGKTFIVIGKRHGKTAGIDISGIKTGPQTTSGSGIVILEADDWLHHFVVSSGFIIDTSALQATIPI